MPILIDILENQVLGREYKRGLQEGELTVLRRLIEKRFGAIPGWETWQIHTRGCGPDEPLSELCARALDSSA